MRVRPPSSSSTFARWLACLSAATDLLRPAVMVNLLGDLWLDGESLAVPGPDFRTGCSTDPTLHLHLYDKGTPRPGRKMGHFTVLDPDVNQALHRAEAHFAHLTERGA